VECVQPPRRQPVAALSHGLERGLYKDYFGSTMNTKGKSMLRFTSLVKRFLRDEDGPTAVEYAVMLALIVVVCIAAITALGTAANNSFSNVSLNTAAS
jgi:pilus assembly protein Flp/PilA